MNKSEVNDKLTSLMIELEYLMWEVVDEIDDLEDEDHELQPLLDKITNMYEIYENDIDIG